MSNNNRAKEEKLLEIWKKVDKLRDSVIAWNFKQYVLGFLFYRYISLYFVHSINTKKQKEQGQTWYDYARLEDDEASEEKEGLIDNFGFFILPSQLFCKVSKRLKNDDNFNETLSDIFRNIEESASDDRFKGLFSDIELNNKKYLGEELKDLNKKLKDVFNCINDIPCEDNIDDTLTWFGEVYEYLITKYSKEIKDTNNSLVSKEAVNLLLNLVGRHVGYGSIKSICDPACGFGSILVAAHSRWKKAIKSFYCYEKSNLYDWARINMIMHGIEKVSISKVDVLSSDYDVYRDNKFSVIISRALSNWKGNDLFLSQDRFRNASEILPNNKADLMYVLHCLHYLDEANGVAAIICSSGALNRSGKEQNIRKYLIEKNYVEAVIDLPPNFVSDIKSNNSILVLKKKRKEQDVLFINASELTNKIDEEYDISSIVKAYYKHEENCQPWKVVSADEIMKNNYELCASTYVRENKDVQQIDINSLESEIKKTVSSQMELREQLDLYLYGNNKSESTTNNELITKSKPIEEEHSDNSYNYKTIGEICYVKSGKPRKKETVGTYPIVSSSDKVYGYSSEFNREANTTTFAWIVRPGLVLWQDKKFWLTHHCWSVNSKSKDEFNDKFIYYALLSKKREIASLISKGTGHSSIAIDKFKSISIPVIPIERQNKIVGLLDKLSALIKCLETEYELRQKQYKLLSNQMLSYSWNEQSTSDYPLKEICNFKQGKPITSSYIQNNQGNYSVYSTSVDEDIGKINSFNFSGEYIICIPNKNNTKQTFNYKNEKFSLTSNAGTLQIKQNMQDKVLYKYLLYILNKFYYIHFYKDKYRIAAKDMEDWKIPIPSIEVQQNIVNVLDKLDQLCNDPVGGINAEIDKRKTQFNYYLNKLI